MPDAFTPSIIGLAQKNKAAPQAEMIKPLKPMPPKAALFM
jgi:hypothetical protein